MMTNEELKPYLTLEPYFSKQRAKQGIKVLRKLFSKVKDRQIIRSVFDKHIVMDITDIVWETESSLWSTLPDSSMFTPIPNKMPSGDITDAITKSLENFYQAKVKSFKYEPMTMTQYQIIYNDLNL
jgi:hypothetical protein